MGSLQQGGLGENEGDESCALRTWRHSSHPSPVMDSGASPRAIMCGSNCVVCSQ